MENSQYENTQQCMSLPSVKLLKGGSVVHGIIELQLRLEKSVDGRPALIELFKKLRSDCTRTPNILFQINSSSITYHHYFDDYTSTLMSTLAGILPAEKVPLSNIFEFRCSSASMYDQRQNLP